MLLIPVSASLLHLTVISSLLVAIYTLFQNGRHFSFLLFTCKLALVASFKEKYSFEFRV